MTLCLNPRCPNPHNSDNAQFCQSCDSELLLKHRYRAIQVLGGGGFGKTYEASDQGKRNKVIKVLIDNSPKAIELFQREAEVLSQLNNPGIPKVEPNSYIVFHPANSQEAVHCLVMEKVEGMNLRDYLKKIGRPIDSDTAKQWLKELVLILQVVHDRGILHRDIKPQNIIFKPDGRLALIDFGAVREGTGTEVATAAGSGGGTEVASHMAGGTSVVSTGYTAPEQMNGAAIKQSDFYSLGRTFVFLLTGREPSTIPYDAHNDVLSWRKYTSNVEPRLAELLDQMQSSLVRMRPKNAQEILQQLNFGETSSQSTGRGEDIEVQLDISSDEAVRGVAKTIRYARFIYTSGQRQQETKEVTVTIPQGVKDGQRLLLKGVGHAGEYGGTSGDVYVRLSVYETAPVIDYSEYENTTKEIYLYAPLWKRLFSGVIDLGFVCIAMTTVYSMSFNFFAIYEKSNVTGDYYITTNYEAVNIMLLLTLSIYYSFEIFTGKSLGKKLFGIAIRARNNKKASWGRSFLRLLLKAISIFPGFLIPFLIIPFNKNKRGIHDFISGTFVVRKID